jgi:hypothetical protein
VYGTLETEGSNERVQVMHFAAGNGFVQMKRMPVTALPLVDCFLLSGEVPADGCI